MSLFTGALADVKSQWFAAQGYVSNTLNDQISAYLAANGGGASNDVNEQWYTFLSAKGNTGALKDMYVAELIKSVPGATSMSVSDLEYMFYGNSANTFL